MIYDDDKPKVIVRNSGIGFFGLLTIVFIALKLTGHINWSWLWVLSPIWLPPVAIISIAIILVLFYIVYAIITKK